MTLLKQIDHMVAHLKCQQIGAYVCIRVTGSFNARYEAQSEKDRIFFCIGEIVEFIRLIALGKVYKQCPICQYDFQKESDNE